MGESFAAPMAQAVTFPTATMAAPISMAAPAMMEFSAAPAMLSTTTLAAPAVTTIPTTTMVAPLVEAFAAPMPTTYGVLPAYGTSTFATAGSATCRFCGNTYMDDSVYCRKCG